MIAANGSLIESFIKKARVSWNRTAVSDTTGKSLTYGKLLTGAVLLADLINRAAPGEDYIGVLLPPSAGGVVANLAIPLSGRAAVNLNYTLPPAAFGSSMEQCRIRHVLTSRKMMDRFGHLPLPEGVIFLDDEMARIRPAGKLKAAMKARFLPGPLTNKKAEAVTTAAVIFSSGSTGDPKGIVLSNGNILSNVMGIHAVIPTTPADSICAVLPFFHCLGYTGTLWFPLLAGLRAVYHTSPLDTATVVEMVRENRCTILLATPTFLLNYMRKAKPEDFSSLRLVITGAERLKKDIADAFENKFGIRPMEGYGATELSPVVSLNTPVFGKDGTVGRPLPGVSVKIVSAETGGPMPAGAHGLIQVKGPNVMAGYLNKPEETGAAIRDGWYDTGDIGFLDDDGFLTVTDRLSRFSKIAGEMVPHLAIEDELHRFLEMEEQALAVVSLHGRKGEKIVVLYNAGMVAPGLMAKAVAECGLPNLWKPSRDCLLPVESLSVLGSGKLDIRGMKELALKILAIRDP